MEGSWAASSRGPIRVTLGRDTIPDAQSVHPIMQANVEQRVATVGGMAHDDRLMYFFATLSLAVSAVALVMLWLM